MIDIDIEFAPERPKVEPQPNRTVDGYEFAFDETAHEIPAIWGRDDEILWSSGEPLMLVAPEGCGKTTIAQQLVLRRAGILRGSLLGLPVARAKGPCLYIAADRPRQAARSLRRMVAETDETQLRERLIVHRGPLPFQITGNYADPVALRDYAVELGVSDIIIDGLKDIALELSSDRVGGQVSIAIQHVIAAGIEAAALHHHRKPQPGAPAPKKLADVYGSRWLTAGMGSVVLFWGEPGDPIVQLRHLKQPAGEVGPFDVLHDHFRGLSTVHDHTDLEQLIAANLLGLTVRDAARLWFKSDTPKPNEVEKTRRKLEALVAANRAQRHEDRNGVVHYRANEPVSTVTPTVWPHDTTHPSHETAQPSHTNGHTALTNEEGTRGPLSKRGQREGQDGPPTELFDDAEPDFDDEIARLAARDEELGLTQSTEVSRPAGC